ncbi:MAG TPA: peptidylprolyl isomerase [Microbacteriaceae bacterium]|nr:peptidylprolyl isomerase [Microbacteriaceae bacterium]
MVKRVPAQSRLERQHRREYEARQSLHGRRTRRRLRDNWISVAAVVLVGGLAIGAQLAYFGWGPGQPAPVPTDTPTAVPTVEVPTDEVQPGENTGPVPDAALAEGRMWTGTLVLNGMPLGVELDGALAPQATAVFVDAAQTGWYDGKYCPRLAVYDTMQVLQCGTDTPDSTNAEADFGFGPIENAPVDDVYPAGTIAMARVGGDGWSMAHQFFIVTAESMIPSDAAGGYTVVGKVTSGLGELIATVTIAGTADGSLDGPPLTPVVIESFTIR